MVDFPTQLYQTEGGGVQIGDNRPQPITYNTNPPPTDLINTNINQQPTIGPEAIERRVRLYDMALASVSPGQEVLRHRVATPEGETSLRNEYAARHASTLQQRQLDLVAQYMRGRQPGQYNQAEMQDILRMTARDVAEAERDPHTFFERRFARELSTQVAPVAQRAAAVNNTATRIIQESSERVTANREYAQRRLEEVHSQWMQQGWGTTIREFGQMAVPFVSWYRMQNHLTREPLPGWLPGSNMREQIENYYSLPPEQASQKLEQALEWIRNRRFTGSETDALLFLNVLASPSSAEIGLLNLSGILDLMVFSPRILNTTATGARILDRVPGLGPRTPAVVDPAARAAAQTGIDQLRREMVQEQGLGGLATSIRDAFRGNPMGVEEAADLARAQRQVAHAAAVDGRASAIQEASGDILGAAITRNQESAQMTTALAAERTGAVDSWDAIRGDIRSIYDVEGIMRGSHLNGANELAQRLKTQASTLLDTVVNNPININRLRPGGVAERQAALEAVNSISSLYPHAAHRIADVRLADLMRATARSLDDELKTLPQGLRDLGKAAHDSVLAIRRANLAGRYSEWRRVETELRELIKEITTLSQQRPKVSPSGNWQLRTSMERAGLPERQEDLNNLIKLAREKQALRGAKGQFSAEERRLFTQADTFAHRFQRSADAMGYKGAFPRPSSPAARALIEYGYEPEIIRGTGNVQFAVVRFHDKDGLLFSSPAAAYRSAVEDLKIPSTAIRIEPQGDGYYIAVHAPLNETSDAVQGWIRIETRADPTPKTWTNSFLNWFRAPNYLVSKEFMDNSLTATYGSSYLSSVVGKVLQENIGKLKFTNKERQNWVSFVERQRTVRDDATGDVGRFSPDQLSFEKEWQTMFNEMPTQSQSAAYWTMVQIMDLDYAVLNLGLYRDKVRQGYQMVGIGSQPAIEGRVLQSLPERVPDWNYGIAVHETGQPMRTFWYGKKNDHITTSQADKQIKELQDQGYKLVQLNHISQEEVRRLPAFADLADDFTPDFIFTKELTASPLPYKQVPRRGGVHHEYDYPYMLRQAKVGRSQDGGTTYYGDVTLHGFKTEAEGQMWLKRYMEAKDMAKRIMDGADNLRPTLANYLERHMPYKLDEFLNFFDKTKPGSLKLDINEQFVLTPTHSRVADKVKYDRDIRDKPHNMFSEVNLRYALERGDGLKNIVESGSKDRPGYHLIQAPMVDAMPSLMSANQHLMRNRYLGDLQHKAAMDFVAEFEDVLQGTRSELMVDPVRTLFTATFREEAAATNPTLYKAAQNYQTVAKNFFSIKSENERVYLAAQQKLADMLHGSYVDPRPWMINFMKDPIQSLRSFVHHYGLMNPVQFIRQASGIVHILAAESPLIGRTSGMASLPAAAYSKWLFASKKAADFADEAAGRVSKWGWQHDHFVESHRALEASGFHNVGREFVTLSDYQTPNYIKGAMGTVRDMGMTSFKWGEESVRMTAWHASYHRWRIQNPTALFDNEAKQMVLSYADTLAGNMSAASRAGWQVDPKTAIGSAFWSYWARISEQMLSPKSPFTAAQRASIVAHYSLFYGVPSGVGLFAFGLPIQQMVDQYLLKKGVAVDNENDHLGIPGWIWNIATNGFISAGIEAAGGGRYDVSGSFAPGSGRIVTDMLQDKSFFEMMTGALGTTFSNVMAAGNPFAQVFFDVFRDKPSGLRITTDEWRRLIVATLPTGASHMERAYYALQLGKYFDKQGLELGGMSTAQSIVFGLTGTLPMDHASYYNILANERTTRTVQQRQFRQMQYYWNKAFEQADKGDLEGSLTSMRQVYAHRELGGWSPLETHRLMTRLVRGNEESITRVFRRYGNQSPEHRRIYEEFIGRQREGN